MRHSGFLKLRLEFDPSVNGGGVGSVSSDDHVVSSGSRTVSIGAPSRFSVRGKRPGGEGDE